MSEAKDETILSRRKLLRAFACTPAFALPTIWPTRASASALVALQGASVALGAISAFTRPGNGLGAMLHAQMQMLQVISDQLNNIQLELARLHETIEDTADDQKAFINQRFLDAETAKISGAARRYREALTASGGDPSHFTIQSVADDINNIRDIVAQTRTSIQDVDGGLGADASLILPVSCAVETAVRIHLGQPSSTIRETLGGYLSWLDKILGIGSGSISHEMSSLASEHDRVVNEIPSYFWLSEEMREQLQIGNNWSYFDASECYLFTQFSVTGQGHDFARRIEPIVRAGGVAYTYWRRVQFSRALDEELGAYLFHVDHENKGLRAVSISRPNGGIEGFPPREMDVCRGGPPARPNLNTSQAIQHIENSDLHKNFQAEEMDFSSFMARLNELRAKLAYHAIARVIAAETRNEVESRLSIL